MSPALPSRIHPLHQGWASVIVGSLLVLIGLAAHSHSGHPAPTPMPAADCGTVAALTPFLDALIIPQVAVPARTNRLYCVPEVPTLCFTNVPEYDMVMFQTNHQFHTNLPPVPVWGYLGQYPGPTILAETNQPILVNWINQLPKVYPDWNSPSTNATPVPSVVHLHGGAVLPRYDGFPTNTFLTGDRDQYFYQNLDLGGQGETLWYHDHANMLTGNNVYAGLAGFYLLRNTPLEQSLNLPTGDFEIGLLLQDKDIQTNCSPASLVYNGVQPLHALAVVNGKVTPYLEVQPALYRFRFLNGSTYRTWQPNLANTDLQGVPRGADATNVPPFTVIATEDGLLASKTDTSVFALMPGERLEVLIDFRNFANQIITMTNSSGLGSIAQVTFTNVITNIMQFRVGSGPIVPAKDVPNQLIPGFVPTSNLVAQAKVHRQITLDLANELPFPGAPFTPPDAPSGTPTGPFALIDMLAFTDPINTFPVAGETEVWSIINLTSEAHPFHVHLLDFRVVGRLRFAGFASGTPPPLTRTNPPSGVINYIQDRAANALRPLTNYLLDVSKLASPAPWESGDKDTVRAAPYSVTTIVMQWPDNPVFYQTPSARHPANDEDTNGRYIYHCHILQHEDDDMMRPMQLLAPSTPDALSIRRRPQSVHGKEMHSPVELRFRTQRGAVHSIGYTSSADFPSRLWSEIPGPRIPGNGGIQVVTPPPASPETSRLYNLITFPR